MMYLLNVSILRKKSARITFWCSTWPEYQQCAMSSARHIVRWPSSSTHSMIVSDVTGWRPLGCRFKLKNVSPSLPSKTIRTVSSTLLLRLQDVAITWRCVSNVQTDLVPPRTRYGCTLMRLASCTQVKFHVFLLNLKTTIILDQLCCCHLKRVNAQNRILSNVWCINAASYKCENRILQVQYYEITKRTWQFVVE